MSRMIVTEAELSALIQESSITGRGDMHVVRAVFGIGWVALLDIPENDWARKHVEEMRAQHEQEADTVQILRGEVEA